MASGCCLTPCIALLAFLQMTRTAASTAMEDDEDDPIKAAMAAGARIPGKGGDDSDDY